MLSVRTKSTRSWRINNMKKLLTISALTVACACAAVPAFAEGGYPNPVGVSFRIGEFYPSETDTQHNAGTNWFSAGFDYKLTGIKRPSFLPKGHFSISLDYTSRESYRSVPLLLNYTSGKIVYASVGAGVTFARFPQDDGNINDRIRFAYSAAIGWTFSQGEIPLFVEARYFGSEMPRVGGVAAYVGARF